MRRQLLSVLSCLSCLSLGCALALPALAQGESAAAVRLVSSAEAGSPGDLAAMRALQLLMQRAGLNYALRHEPTERAVISLRAGLYDADLLRYAGFEKVVPGAVRVDPHLLSTTLVAFSRPPGLKTAGWESLRGLRVAYVRGIKLIERELAGRPGLQPTSSAPSCLGMVAADRVDVCLLNAETSAAAPELIDGTRLHRRVLVDVPLYVWAAPGHEALAQRLSKTLVELVASGELAPVVQGFRVP